MLTMLRPLIKGKSKLCPILIKPGTNVVLDKSILIVSSKNFDDKGIIPRHQRFFISPCHAFNCSSIKVEKFLIRNAPYYCNLNPCSHVL